MRIAMLYDTSGSMVGLGDVLGVAFCQMASPETKKIGKFTLISYGTTAEVLCLDEDYDEYIKQVRDIANKKKGLTNLDAGLIEFNKLGKFDYLYILCDGFPNEGRGQKAKYEYKEGDSWIDPTNTPFANEIKTALKNAGSTVGVSLNETAGAVHNPLQHTLEEYLPHCACHPQTGVGDGGRTCIHFTTFGFTQTDPSQWGPTENWAGLEHKHGFYSEDHS